MKEALRLLLAAAIFAYWVTAIWWENAHLRSVAEWQEREEMARVRWARALHELQEPRDY